MLKNDLFPPQSGAGADPVLFGVAAGLAELFPPVISHTRPLHEAEAESDGGADEDGPERD
ncbi:hypothetical protein [Methylobacterium trifolii]|uniref:Uncharacterized protein n=1 Tax=Methylobacterium trifolii TaxID=1003092 RepID=A0ABQ4U3A4_9HYPH|nr:hypothetical protein [Methylobacterium trifolii]GJE61236.1 hypothetical protein MPOCJGCO_3357 [Methylobacterium trifolii]